MEGVLKGLHGSAVEMVELLYEIFTGKRVQQMPVIEVEVRRRRFCLAELLLHSSTQG
jgi:hypothetical protein